MTRPPTVPERMLARVLTHERIGVSILGDLAERPRGRDALGDLPPLRCAQQVEL